MDSTGEVQVHVRLTEATKRKLARKARANHRHLNQEVAAAVDAWVADVPDP